MIQQELGNELPFEKRLASLLTLIEVDRDDPAFGRSDEADRPDLRRGGGERLAGEKGWVVQAGRRHFRRVVPSPLPQRIFGIEPIEWLLEHGCVVDVRRRRRDPGHVHGRAGAAPGGGWWASRP